MSTQHQLYNHKIYKTYLVNLKRRPDRLEKFLEKYPLPDKQNIVMIEAFDGKTPTENKYETNTYKDIQEKSRLAPGEIGCFLSHLHIWKKIINDNLPYALIFEDDTYFCDDFKEKWEKILQSQLTPVDTILYLGGRPTPNYKTFSGKMISQDIIETNTKVDRDRTTHAYFLTKEGAQFLVKTFYEKMKNPYTTDKKYHFRAVDHYMLMAFRRANTRVHNTQPHLTYSPIIEGESDTF